jgi:hypothetical protein
MIGNKMMMPLTGSWQSVRSNIPDYQPGHEWQHFIPEGDHEWEIGQPGGRGRPSRNRVRVKEEKDGYALLLVQDGAEVGAPARITYTGHDEIQVVPAHGFVTAFRRSQQPNQSAQAGSLA